MVIKIDHYTFLFLKLHVLGDKFPKGGLYVKAFKLYFPACVPIPVSLVLCARFLSYMEMQIFSPQSSSYLSIHIFANYVI